MKQNSSTPETAGKHTSRKQGTEEAAGAEARAEDGARLEAATAAAPDEGLDEQMLAALHAASDRKALDLVALDLRAIASFTDFFLLATGTNQRQVQAIADAVVERLKTQGRRAARVEGYNAAEWVLLDYGDFIFHVFEEKARRFYDLERLWRDALRVVLPRELAGDADAARGGAMGAGDDLLLRGGSSSTER